MSRIQKQSIQPWGNARSRYRHSCHESATASTRQDTKAAPIRGTVASASFSAEISVRSPRKLFICIIYKNVLWIKESEKKNYLILKTEALTVASTQSNTQFSECTSFLAEISVRSPQKIFILIIWKIFSGSKYPKNFLCDFEKGTITAPFSTVPHPVTSASV